METSRARRTNIGLLVFVASLCFLSVVYGFYAHRFQLFPYKFLTDSALAVDALVAIATDRVKPNNFLDYAPDVDAAPSAIPVDRTVQSDDWILITGGPFEFLEECPNFGCLAWIVDRSGRVIHSWETDLDALWRDADHIEGLVNAGSMKWLGVDLLSDGGLLVAFHAGRAFPEGGGLARFDRDGGLVWFNDLNIHHWFTRDRAGTIYAPAHEAVPSPVQIGHTRNRLACDAPRMQLDYVAILGADGRLRERIPILDLLADSGYAGLVQTTTDHCDPFHLNFVQVIDPDRARAVTIAEPGDLLISLRNINTILIFSPATREIKWLSTGGFVRQHSPRLGPDGDILTFDNLGGDHDTGGSRIVRQNLDTAGLSVVVPNPDAPLADEFYSEYGGHISIDRAGRRMLVSLTEAGRIVEFDVASGAPLWRYEKVFPISGFPVSRENGANFVRTEAFGAYYVDMERFRDMFDSDK